MLPGFIEEREMWRVKTTSIAGCGQSSSCRWRDWNFLNFWFRGVEQNVSWVNKVFLVVKDKSHIPSWLNLDHPKLRIVFHDEYIPKQFLPTFNTHVIEMFYANIPDLSEYYITCNDDFFFTNLTPKDYFIVNGIPVRDLRHKQTKIGRGDWSVMLKNGQVLLSKIYFDGNSLPYTFDYTHLPELRCKSLENDLMAKWKDKFYATLGDGKFRSRKNCVSSWLFVDALKYDKRYPKIQKDDIYSKSYYMFVRYGGTLKNIYDKIINQKAQMICINDTQRLIDKFFPIAKNFITEKLFPKCFPKKSKYEI